MRGNQLLDPFCCHCLGWEKRLFYFPAQNFPNKKARFLAGFFIGVSILVLTNGIKMNRHFA